MSIIIKLNILDNFIKYLYRQIDYFQLEFYIMNKKIKIVDKFLPQRSILGFKVLNSWQSIIAAYFFILVQFFLTPYFGFESGEIKASLFFIILINVSIFILLINSLIRIRNINLLFLFFEIPLIIYTPQFVKKIVTSLYYIKQIYSL